MSFSISLIFTHYPTPANVLLMIITLLTLTTSKIIKLVNNKILSGTFFTGTILHRSLWGTVITTLSISLYSAIITFTLPISFETLPLPTSSHTAQT